MTPPPIGIAADISARCRGSRRGNRRRASLVAFEGDDADAQRLPDNVRVIEFYCRAGAILGNATAQQSYISSNYSHVARDLMSRGVNLLMCARSAATR